MTDTPPTGDRTAATSTEVAGVLAPWAIDADAQAVPTRFTLDGTTLVQTVDHDDAVYPVVADPVFVPIAVAI